MQRDIRGGSNRPRFPPRQDSVSVQERHAENCRAYENRIRSRTTPGQGVRDDQTVRHTRGIKDVQETPKAVQKVVQSLLPLFDKPGPEINAVEEKWVWRKIEAALDSGAVDHVIDPRLLPGLNVVETVESKAGKVWTGPSGEEIPKLGMIKMPWVSEDGKNRSMVFQAGSVGRPLLSASRLEDAGFETRLSKRGRVLMNLSNGEKFNLRRVGGLYVLTMWCRVKDDGSFQRPATPP